MSKQLKANSNNMKYFETLTPNQFLILEKHLQQQSSRQNKSKGLM